MLDVMTEARRDLLAEWAADERRADMQRALELGLLDPPDDYDEERELGDLLSEEELEEIA